MFKLKYKGNIVEIDEKAYRHTCSHILAQAVKRLYKDVKLAIGPSIDDGFYYDFDTEEVLELNLIEKEMKKIIKENLKLERLEVSRSEALELMKDEPYKIELINDIEEGETISFYKQGEFIDLCAGPHIESTGMIKAYKLLNLAGAYWRGSEKNKMLKRIYATCFTEKEALEEYLNRLEEAKKRDHRKLGKELELFIISEEGPGFPFFLPKGMALRNTLENFWREEHKNFGYEEIKTPVILSEELWHRSGHYDHYKENMYYTKIDENDYAIKPMNCPGGMIVYKSKQYSYRDLPKRLAELGLVHRHELSGTLHGLMRVRCFTQDDAHIFMLPEQIREEVINTINLVDYFYKVFGFKYKVELSTRPENSMGSEKQWETAIAALKDALEINNIDYTLNEGDGAFYGPKIDFHLQDSIGRTWQCGTIQLDFQMPERFDLTYTAATNEKLRPVMLHRAIFGSLERFIAILTEHYAGQFPVWLAPTQLKILGVSEKHNEYILKLHNMFKEHDFRVEADMRNEKIGYKIREAQLLKVPYMLIIGDKEVQNETVSVRSRIDGDIGEISVQEFVNLLLDKIKKRS